MKPLFKKIFLKVALAAIILSLLSAIFYSFHPLIVNSAAMGQLENDNFAFAAWEAASNLTRVYEMLRGCAVGVTGIAIVVDVYNFFVTRKENEVNENV